MNKNIFIAVCSALILASCTDAKQPAGKALTTDSVAVSEVIQLTAEQLKNAGVVTGLPTKRSMHSHIKVAGTTEVPPQSIVSVSIALGGYVKKISLLPGEHVAKGSVMAIVEDQQYIQLQQDYLTAKSKLEYYEAEYSRQRQLNETKAASDKVYQQAKSDYESQRILQRSLAQKLMLVGINPASLNESNVSRSVNIYAPISGYVTKVNVNNGKYVSATDVLFELVNPEELHLTLNVFEQDASSIAVGQVVKCFANNNREQQYTAKVHFINPSIGNERYTEVHCDFVNGNKQLLPGMYMNAEIEISREDLTCVPEEAIVRWEGEDYVFEETGQGKYKMSKVVIGMADSGFVAITEGLPTGNIAVSNAYALLSKLKNNAEE
jgi:cobalt-zinc-cadmium efflux system membrane fusion protein